jgi:hypothetical protein
MADEGKICVCPKCGKKFRLKEGFDAKSFSCMACGATVWVAGKPPAPAPASRGPAGAPVASTRGGRGGRAASRGAGRHGRGHEEEAAEGGRRGRGHGREKPKSNTNLLMALGAVAVVGIIVVVAVMSGDKGEKKDQTQPVAQQPGGTTETPGLAATTTGTQPAGTPSGQPAGTQNPPASPTETGTPAETAPPAEGETAPSPEGGEKPPKLGDGKKPDGTGRYDPPATLGHLEITPPEQRKQIDDLIGVMFDVQAGRDSHDAKTKLAAIGKPAFLPILGKMAAIRDTITDNDTLEERMTESSLMLADQALREMDGYLDAHDKGIIRPGTDKKYIKYILVLHYRRWNDGLGSRPLKDMDTMPGPFDPTTMQKEEGAPDDEEAGK